MKRNNCKLGMYDAKLDCKDCRGEGEVEQDTMSGNASTMEWSHDTEVVPCECTTCEAYEEEETE